MRDSDAIRATTPAATCELRLSARHAPSSAGLSPLELPTAASRELPARRDLIDIFIGSLSRQHLMRGRRCCSQVTQEGCARVWCTWPILPRQYASRGTEEGACRVRIECGGRFVGLSTRNIDPVSACLSVGLMSPLAHRVMCQKLCRRTKSSCGHKSDISLSCTRQAQPDPSSGEARPTQHANTRSRHRAPAHATRALDRTYCTFADAGRRRRTQSRCRRHGARTQSAQAHARAH